MAELTAYARYVTVGRPAPDQVPPDRLSFYRWLVLALSSRTRCRVKAKDLYVTTGEMKTNPAIIRTVLDDDISEGDDQASVMLIDLAVNPYHLFRDIFLFHVMDTAQRWLASRSRQIVIILLPGPGLPPPASMFWSALRDPVTTRNSERLLVIANDGTMWPDRTARQVTSSEYVRQRNKSTKPLTEQLELRVISKPGHYSLGTPEDPHCARYFFETEQAEHEIGELVIDWVENTLRPALPPGERLTLVSQAKQSESFHDAIAGAATSLGCSFMKLDDAFLEIDNPGEMAFPAWGPGWVAPVFHAVNSGATFRAVVGRLRSLGAKVTTEALTVMVTGGELSVDADGVRLRALCGPYSRGRVSQDNCVQCSLNLPHTPAKREEQIGIRAFDMWEICFESGWGKEQFGAPPKQRYPHLPDLGQVFSRHGNWIAYKVYYLLKTLGADGELAFVCPAEANVEELVLHLGILLQNHQVTIRVPPPVIRGRNWAREVSQREDEDWHRQLRHLKRQHFPTAVIIDEIAGSKTTAEGLVRLLRSFDLEPFAYIPIIDFSPDRPLRGVPTYPLYRIPNPRGDQ
jgi:hypothetical protein